MNQNQYLWCMAFKVQCFEWDLTLILLEPKMIRLKMPPLKSQASLHIFSVRTRCILLAFQLLILISLKMIMDTSKYGRWIILLKKFSKLGVKLFFGDIFFFILVSIVVMTKFNVICVTPCRCKIMWIRHDKRYSRNYFRLLI